MKSSNEHKKKLRTLSDRLNYLIDAVEIKKADLARAIGVHPQTIQYLCTGDCSSSKFTFEIATILGANSKWLATGEGDVFLSDDSSQLLLNEYKKIPLLTHEQLILKSINNKFKKSDIKSWGILKTSLSNIFCIIVNDNSMEPLIKNGSRIFYKEILLEKNFKSNQLVVVYSKRHNTVMVREVIYRGKTPFLVPCNADLFKEVEFSTEFVVIGDVIEYHVIIRME